MTPGVVVGGDARDPRLARGPLARPRQADHKADVVPIDEAVHDERAVRLDPRRAWRVHVAPHSAEEPVQGLQQALAVFGYTRLMVAAFGLGAGWAALDRAIEYSTERVQAGSTLAEKRGYTHKLIVPHAARLEAARAYIEEVQNGKFPDEDHSYR